MREVSNLFNIKNKYTRSKLGRYFLQSIGIFIALALLIKTGDLVHGKLLIAPLGASCVILFGFPESHFSRPRNIIGGYFISSLVGVSFYNFFGNNSWGTAVAVSFAVLIMLLTELMHPPAGAVAIIAITTSSGWMFILVPVMLGTTVIVTISVVYNKIHKGLELKIRNQSVIPKIESSEWSES